jgi:hypothetical protein
LDNKNLDFYGLKIIFTYFYKKQWTLL